MQMFSLKKEHFDEIALYAEKDGPAAIGGAINTHSIIKAYSLGLFPWNNENEDIMWYSPDPRMVLKPQQALFSKSLLKSIKKQEFEVQFDTDFKSVITHCSKVKRDGQYGTWITKAVKKTFIELHLLGLAHSVEVYQHGKIVGGLYGLSLGKTFFGESMFHLLPNASKTAFYHLVEFLNSNNFDLIDAQQETPYLASFGAKPIPRMDFIEILKESVQKTTLVGNWNNSFIETKLIDIL